MPGQKVFISYAHKDGTELASRLNADLTKNGYDVWLDKSRLQGGESWSRDIEAEIDRADTVLALMSLGSYDSEVCRGEQLRGLRRGKCVIPVRLQSKADIPVFLEARQFCDLSDAGLYEKGFRQVIQAIDNREGAPLVEQFRETPYDTVPPLPANFIPREKELLELRKLVMNEPENRKLALVALRGMGGLGKTVMAQALCQDPVIKDAFPEGIIWIKLGEKPEDADLIEQMREAIRVLGPQPEHFDSLARASNSLRTLLQNKATLLVLDDVWEARHVALFQPNNPRCCRLLLTTRSVDVVAATAAREHIFGVLGEDQARKLLESCAGRAVSSLPPAAQGLLQACDGLPLALAIVGGMLYGEPEARWQSVLNSITGVNLDAIALQFPTYKYLSLAAAFTASIESLEPDHRQNYLDLAVLPPDTPVPVEALAVLWSTTVDAAGSVVSRFVRRSLASYDGTGRLVVHDLLLDYVRARRRENLAALHQQLLDSYRRRCGKGWHTGPDDGYFFEQLTYHLKEAGRQEEVSRIVLDFDWIETKLKTKKIAGLLTDYARALPGTGATRLAQESVLLSAYILAEHPDQIGAHLTGRLQGEPDPAVTALLDRIRARPGTWLRPISASLLPPGGPLLRTLTGKGGWFEAIAVPAKSPDQAVTVCRAPLGGPSYLEMWDVRSGIVTRTLRSELGEVTDVALTSDCRLAVTSARSQRGLFGLHPFADRDNSKTPEDGNVVTIWELGAEKARHILSGHGADVAAVAFTPDGRFAVSASWDKTLIVWDVGSGERVRTLTGHSGIVKDVAVTPDGRQVVSAGDRWDPVVRVWDLDSGNLVRLLQAHSAGFVCVAVTPDGRRIAAATEDKSIVVWDALSGSLSHVLRGHADEIHDIVATRDSRLLLSAAGEAVYSEDKTIKVWDLETGTLVRTLAGHQHLVSGLAVPADNRSVLSVSLDGTLKEWDILRYSDSIAARHQDAINAIDVLQDGGLAISASNDRKLKIWDLESGKLLNTLSGHKSSVEKVVLDSVHKRALSVSGNFASGAKGELIAWELTSAQPVRTWELEGCTRALAITPDGRLVVVTGANGDLLIVNLEGGDGSLRRLKGHEGEVFCLAATPDSRYLLSGAGDRTVRIWTLYDEFKGRLLGEHTGDVTSLTVTPDGRFAVSGSVDNTLKVWDLSTFEGVRTLNGHKTLINKVSASGDGRFVFSNSGDGILNLWRTGSWELLNTYSVKSVIYDQAITPDSCFLAVACVNGTFSVWDVQTGERTASFQGEGGINTCACSPDSRTFVAGDRAGGVHFLRLEGK
jgi:WD40 repeat protein